MTLGEYSASRLSALSVVESCGGTKNAGRSVRSGRRFGADLRSPYFFMAA
jgi:hypothetical protein